MKPIAYIRVSTKQQGRSGLGLEAQLAAIAHHEPIHTYVEIESGKRDRPQLALALAHAKRLKATLVVAKLDRLARNARFLLSILESGVDVIFCDFPTIPSGPLGKFMLTQMAAVAELEAGLISERTKAALAAAKARGVRLGASRPGSHRFTEEEAARGRRPVSDDALLALKAQGLSSRVIGAQLGLSYSRVARRLRRASKALQAPSSVSP